MWIELLGAQHPLIASQVLICSTLDLLLGVFNLLKRSWVCWQRVYLLIVGCSVTWWPLSMTWHC